MEKKISVITSVFNGEKTIEDTILSVLNQDYSNFELIIVDGLSKDSTIKIVQKYAETDTRIKIISEKDKGIYDAFNKGVLNSSGTSCSTPPYCVTATRQSSGVCNASGTVHSVSGCRLTATRQSSGVFNASGTYCIAQLSRLTATRQSSGFFNFSGTYSSA